MDRIGVEITAQEVILTTPPVARCQQDGLAWYRFFQLAGDVEHALLTRLGGVSTGHLAALNLGSTVGDDPVAVRENHRRAFAALGVQQDTIVTPFQVHGCNVVRVGSEDRGRLIPATDALVTNTSEVTLLMRFADCAPVLFFDPVHRAVGLAHAGWRGIVAGVIPETVRAMVVAFETCAADLWVGIGPTIGRRHYAVGTEVLEAIADSVPPQTTYAESRGGQWFLDLPAAITAQLHAAGVMTVVPSQLDTAGRTDEWYSHRAEHGRTGRFGVLMRLR